MKECTPCPAQSVAPVVESTMCLCIEGKWRVPGEGPRSPCGSPPSAPAAYKVYYLDTHSVNVNWSEPLDTGNRTDLTYQVQCVAGCKDVSLTRDWSAAGSDRSVIVSLDDIWVYKDD